MRQLHNIENKQPSIEISSFYLNDEKNMVNIEENKYSEQ